MVHRINLHTHYHVALNKLAAMKYHKVVLFANRTNYGGMIFSYLYRPIASESFRMNMSLILSSISGYTTAD